MQSQTNHRYKALGIIVLGIMLLAAYYANQAFFDMMFRLIIKGDVASSIHYIQSFGADAKLVSFIIIVIINSLAVLPNISILAANGVIFGVVEGTLISWIAESVGVTISFILMRYVFRDYTHSLVVYSQGLKRIDEFSGRKGFRIMLAARCIPYVPSGLITALGALSSIRLVDYILATFIGKLPAAFIEVTLGHDLLAFRYHMLRLTILLLVSAVGYYLFSRYRKKAS